MSNEVAAPIRSGLLLTLVTKPVFLIIEFELTIMFVPWRSTTPITINIIFVRVA